MKMICDVPNEVIESIRMGTWCGSSVVKKMITNGTPIHDNATNSYVMLTMFPNETDLHTFARHKKVVWWNAPYKS